MITPEENKLEICCEMSLNEFWCHTSNVLITGGIIAQTRAEERVLESDMKEVHTHSNVALWLSVIGYKGRMG